MSTICKWVCLLFLQTMMFLSKKSFWISLTYCSITFLPHKLLHDWNEMDEIYYRRKFHDFRELFCWWSQSDGKSLVASMNYVMSLSAHPEMPWELKKQKQKKNKIRVLAGSWVLLTQLPPYLSYPCCIHHPATLKRFDCK